jgi:carnitine O-palmitoyltransferase 1
LLCVCVQIMLPIKVVPLCSAQYLRQFNTTRVPGVETDTLVHYNDSQWVVVYHKGRYFKMYVYYKGKLLLPVQIEM